MMDKGQVVIDIDRFEREFHDALYSVFVPTRVNPATAGQIEMLVQNLLDKRTKAGGSAKFSR